VKAFVIHSRHATFRLFYAKLPHRYLHNVAACGVKYLAEIPPQYRDRIQLYQSRPYRMRDLRQQAEFLCLLGKLLYYILSGHSHVGYMRNCHGNMLSVSPVRFYCPIVTDGISR